jgi:hypothetical protein
MAYEITPKPIPWQEFQEAINASSTIRKIGLGILGASPGGHHAVLYPKEIEAPQIEQPVFYIELDCAQTPDGRRYIVTNGEQWCDAGDVMACFDWPDIDRDLGSGQLVDAYAVIIPTPTNFGSPDKDLIAHAIDCAMKHGTWWRWGEPSSRVSYKHPHVHTQPSPFKRNP